MVMLHIRPPAVAGSFYPGDPQVLRAAVAGHLGRVGLTREAVPHPPKMLVVPHAG
jgi:hypothetical protein